MEPDLAQANDRSSTEFSLFSLNLQYSTSTQAKIPGSFDCCRACMAMKLPCNIQLTLKAHQAARSLGMGDNTQTCSHLRR